MQWSLGDGDLRDPRPGDHQVHPRAWLLGLRPLHGQALLRSRQGLQGRGAVPAPHHHEEEMGADGVREGSELRPLREGNARREAVLQGVHDGEGTAGEDLHLHGLHDGARAACSHLSGVQDGARAAGSHL